MSTTFTFPTLETERLILRVPRFEDFDGISELFISERSRFIGGPVAELKQRWRTFGHVAGMWMLRGYGTFVFERKDTGEAVGHGGPWHPITWPERELGWSLWTEEAEWHGYCTEAMTTIREHVFGDLGWETAVSYIDPDNTASIRVAERLGATIDPDATLPDDEPTVVYRHVRRAT